LPLKYFLSLFCLVSVALIDSIAPAEELSVHLKTTPRLELLRPFADPIGLSVLVTGADGKPVKEGTITIRLNAPPPGLFFSTDFPMVEGTLMSEMQLPLRQGKADWKYLFPIRGEYRLAVDAIADGGRKASKVFTITVRENRVKWLILSAFSAGLFALGFGAGRIFTGPKTAGMGAIMVVLLWGSSGISSAQPVAVTALKIDPATVGKPSLVRWNPGLENGAQNLPVSLSLSITHVEKEKVVFAIDKVPVSGEWSMKFHFPDGADYRVSAVTDFPGRAPVRSEQIVSVTGVEPPARPMAAAVSYFLALIALGLGTGRWSMRRGG
jgi:hypothetical protein